MRKKILYLENKGEVSHYLVKDLERMGFIVFKAKNIIEAESHYDDNKDIDLFIIDLNLKADGLNDEQISRTMDGLFTGWVWFKDYVLSTSTSAKEKCIVYSDYLKQLKEHLGKGELEGIDLLPKKSDGRAKGLKEIIIQKLL